MGIQSWHQCHYFQSGYCRKRDKRINHESKLLKPKACLVEGAIYVYTYIRLENVGNATNSNHQPFLHLP